MVGRTGIYELNDDIVISSLRFIKPQEYILNEALSKELQNTGISTMKKARDKFLEAINKLTQDASFAPDGSVTSSTYWTEFNNAHQEYVHNYEIGLGIYTKGKSGVYVEQKATTDLHNIIIDFTYESKTGGGI